LEKTHLDPYVDQRKTKKQVKQVQKLSEKTNPTGGKVMTLPTFCIKCPKVIVTKEYGCQNRKG
jgi:hypothetical protein